MTEPTPQTSSDIALLRKSLARHSGRIISACTLAAAHETSASAAPSVLDSIQNRLPQWMDELIALLPEVMSTAGKPAPAANRSLECRTEHRLDVVIKALSGIREVVVLELLQLKGAVADGFLDEVCREVRLFFDLKIAGYALQFVAAQEAELALRTRQLQEAKDQLAAASEASRTAGHSRVQLSQAVTHELRNTLQSVLLYAASLIEGPRDPGTTEIVERLAINGTHLQRLLDRVRAHASLLAGTLQACPAPVTLAEFLSELEQRHRALARANQTQLSCRLAGGPASVMTDRDLLNQIADDLVDNAIHSTASGLVTVEISAENPQQLLLTVTDNGGGISLPEARQIFRVLHHRSGSNPQGLRLGLLASRCLAHLLGGDITFKSEAGQGASFTLSLPTSFHPPEA